MHAKNGFVYAVTYNGLTKIGRAKDPEKRTRAVVSQAGLNMQDCEITKIETGDYYKCETNTHKSLKESRKVGEWFSVSHAVAVSEINKNKTDLQQKTNEKDIDIRSLFVDPSSKFSQSILDHLFYFGTCPINDTNCYYTLLPTFERTCESKSKFDYVINEIFGYVNAQIELGEPPIWDLHGYFSILADGDIAVMEKIIANAVSDGINAGMEYKDVYKLAKNRCLLAVPAIGLK